ncbi:CPBP family intramembrane glutamic endopeptidase [Saccharibacillus alkalitolerans]|uniref:CPBP family intramembrane metalloprotease n=1 Tax=Saccharibacillus alkalitolerans TaxID=2705290 RepID=A0ABX0F373_9BACL|nr:CPBP family intramembrane glutamic endopeptidase [Saccharibacillus alkalitolerans]NGZ74103.1 CPBP family intramembrane metalloprotease [Saccharibacillus alkalitolerans]
MDWIGVVVIPLGLAGLVYILGKVFGLHEAQSTRLSGFDRHKLLLIWIALLVQVFIAIAALYALRHSGLKSSEGPVLYTPGKLLLQFSMSVLIMVPFLTIKWKLRESWSSTGVSREGSGKALLLGFAAALAYIVVDLWRNGFSFRQAWDMFDMNFVWALPLYAAVGFSEEWIFRGYVQPRFEFWLGRIPGWLLASLVMAFIHVPQRILIGGMPMNDALLSSLELLPISLLLGYMRMRTGTIWAPVVLHAGVDWELVFFGI